MQIFKSKTVWTGIIGIITAVAGGATGQMTNPEAIAIAIQGLSAIFLRLAVSKATGAPLDSEQG